MGEYGMENEQAKVVEDGLDRVFVCVEAMAVIALVAIISSLDRSVLR